MKKVLTVLAALSLLSAAACVGKAPIGKGKTPPPPPPVVTKG